MSTSSRLSRTALGSAAARAAHLIVDDEPTIFRTDALRPMASSGLVEAVVGPRSPGDADADGD